MTSKKKETRSVLPLKSEAVFISDPQGKANILNNQYSSVFSKKEADVPAPTDSSPHSDIPEIEVTAPGV